MRLSNLSKKPPCPGNILLESFTPKERFNIDSERSPKVANTTITIAAHSQSYSFDVKNYLKNKICYDFTEERKQAQSLFLKKCSEL